MRVSVQYQFVGADGKRSHVRVFPGAGITDLSGWQGQALALAAALTGVSDAVLTQFVIEAREDEPISTPAEVTSDVARAGVLLYTNADNIFSLRLPSIRTVLAETDGRYAGRRISRASAGVSGLLEDLDSIPQPTLDPLGREASGSVFSIGAIVGI